MLNVSIIIVSFNTVNYLRECLTAVHQHAANAEIIVVDNASVDGSCAMVSTEFPRVKLIELSQNVGFGEGNNIAVQQATQPYIVLLNSDAVLLSDTVNQLSQYLQHNPQVSCVSPKVVLPITGVAQPKTFGFAPTLQHVFMQSTGLSRLAAKCDLFKGVDGEQTNLATLEVDWISGVCMAMRTADYLRVGGFDARFFMYCEDIELCLRLQKIGKIMVLNAYDVMHYGGASAKTIQAKARNSVWQQRHLLIIIRQYSGFFSAVSARLLLGLGLLLRLIIAACKIPARGVKQNEALLCAWVRLKDLCGVNTLKGLT